jgi:FecR protein
MNQRFRESDHVEVDTLFALAAGDLPEADACAANVHLTLCRACRRMYAGARELQREALRLGDSAASGVDDVTHRRIWRTLAPEAAAAAHRVGQRRAWSMVLASGRLRWAAAIVVLASTGLLVYGLGRGPQPARTGAESGHDGAEAAQRQGRSAEPGQALGPPSSSRLADSLRQTPTRTRRGMVHGRLGQMRHRRAPRPESLVAMDLDLTVPLPARLAPSPGERRLRCGGLLVARGATVRVVRDQPRAALIRLSAGHVGLRVPKLPRGGRVEIVTPDARVRVVGTRFTVRRGQKPQTTVTVTEGVVWVTPTGRNRQTVVLRAGESRTVLGEGAYLKQLRGQITAALRSGRLQEAARLGRRYLNVTSKPAGASTMKLRLAGIVARLGRTAEAVRLYQDVMGSAPQAVARQNALAFLARLYERLGKKHMALGIWRGLTQKYPGGLFAIDALMALVRAGCRQVGASPERHRRHLARRAGGHRAARALLRRCQPRPRRK